MRNLVFIIPLLLLFGCQSVSDVYTCTARDWKVVCGSSSSSQDSSSSSEGVKDEKPDRTFQEPAA